MRSRVPIISRKLRVHGDIFVFFGYFCGSESPGRNNGRAVEILVAADVIKVFVRVNDQIDIGRRESNVAQRVLQITKARIDSRIDHDGLIGSNDEVHVTRWPPRRDLEDAGAHFKWFFALICHVLYPPYLAFIFYLYRLNSRKEDS